MKAAEIVEQMKTLVPDSRDELQYVDTEWNKFIYVSKESASSGDYYRFRIGANVYMFAEKVEAYMGATNDEALKLYTSVPMGMSLSGILYVDTWEVRGE